MTKDGPPVATEAELVALLGDDLIPQWRTERERLDRIDKWWRWSHDDPHMPRQATKEYKELIARSQTPGLGLVVSNVAQLLYVDGYRASGADDNAAPWAIWQANGWDARQIAIHRAALAYGVSYATILPGRLPTTGEPMPVMRGVSPRRMMAFYEDPAEDDWPTLALRIDFAGKKAKIRVYDAQSEYHFSGSDSLGELKLVDVKDHEVGFCPVVRYCNALDLEGRTDGEVEPYIPVAGRVDQTVADRLIVQRFASWTVRTIAGMAQPDKEEDANLEKLRLKIEDILVASDPDTKFGTLPGTPLDGFIKAHESDVKDLAAVTQTPPQVLLGAISNLSAEALAAAEVSLGRKVDERKMLFGESHEQALRVAAWIAGDAQASVDFSAQVTWRDMGSRLLSQTADALGKLAQMLGVPVEMLWEKIPGWTQTDVDRAKMLVEQSGPLNLLMQELASSTSEPPAAPAV